MARRRNPVPTLLVLVAVPALLLGACWRYASARVPAPSTAAEDVTGAAPPPAALVTPLLSVRRAPAVLARDVNLAAFTAEVTAFLDRIGDASCAAFSIDGVPVAAKNETQQVRPASNVKLITASVAAEVLGLDYTFTTEVRGALSGGVVTGNLYLVGGGDPVLNNSWWNGPNAKFPPFNSTSVEEFVDRIVAAGVTRIDGSVVGDASRYDEEWYAPSWFDDVKFVEGGPVSALLIDDSRETPTKAANDPVVGAAAVITNELRDRGVAVSGEPSRGLMPGATPVIASITSQPLPAILAEMLTTSDNTSAEMLLKEIGHVRSSAGTREGGLAVVMQTLQSWGVPMDGIELVDGSGLSDDNRVTCAALLAVLQHQSFDDVVGSGLPVAAQPGGTLADAFDGTPMAGVLRAKTGTLYNYADGVGGRPAVKALSGFVPVEGGGAIEFSLLLNGPQIAEQVEYRPIWDALAVLLAAYPSGPSAADLGPVGVS
ncbi:MAG: D-alanyl-D-alanine carboxypeptidase/D-alanyl-D-alanine endopeptidase [Ilumatobacteraceae bacterium]